MSFRRSNQLLAGLLLCVTALGWVQAQPVVGQSMSESAKHSLANSFVQLIKLGIPTEYEKAKDWGHTRKITVGLRNEGIKLYRRKKAVNHGIWKRYKVRLVDPEEKLQVRLENLKTIDGGRIGFRLVVTAKLDAWARAKVYQYGVHLIALEVVGDTDVEIALDCEVGVSMGSERGYPVVAIDPEVVDARVRLSEFHLRRVSNAKGPLVHELSSGVRRLVEHELKGPKLAAKLNRSIDKRRDRLELDMSQLVNSSWWPLASLPEVGKGIEKVR